MDYNRGVVLPVALPRGVRAERRPARSRQVRSALGVADLADPPAWGRLFAGLLDAAAARGLAVGGFELTLTSTLPVGGGLSSSAASAVAAALALWPELAQDELRLAHLVMDAEHRGLGVRCGLMDPLAIAAARAGHVVAIDCRDETWRHAPLDAAVVVVRTATDRRLAGSGYNARRAACERAARALGVECLRDASEADLARIPDPTDRARARHVVREMARVARGRVALEAGDLASFGREMSAGHASLRDDYGVSTPALDALVERCAVAPESYGGRLTGAGFGGCTVHLVRPGAEAAFGARLAAVEGAVETIGGRPQGGARVEIPG